MSCQPTQRIGSTEPKSASRVLASLDVAGSGRRPAPLRGCGRYDCRLRRHLRARLRAHCCSSSCSGWFTSCPKRSHISEDIHRRKRSIRSACCRWSSADCSGRWRGCGRIRSLSCTRWRMAQTRSVTLRMPLSTPRARPWSQGSVMTSPGCDRMSPHSTRNGLGGDRVRLRLELESLEERLAITGESSREAEHGSHPPRHLCVVRLAGFLQVQVAGLDDDGGGDRRHDSDLRSRHAACCF